MRVGVVGGGPAGLLTSSLLGEGGVDVEVFEEHPEIGIPNHCTSVVSEDTLSSNGVRQDKVVKARLRRLKIGVPNEVEASAESSETKALVIDRPSFDLELAKRASRAGCTIHLKTRVEVDSAGDRTGVEFGEERRSFDYVVDATGAKSYMRREGGEVLPAMQFDLYEEDLDRETAEVWMDKSINPEFFIWCVPVGDEVTRVGTASKASLLEKSLDKFLSVRFADPKKLNTYYGLVVLSGPAETFVDGNLIRVGDAAGQTKPVTGGGLRYGLHGAKLAASSLLELRDGGALGDYRRAWDDKWGDEVRVQLRVRRLMRRLDNKGLVKMVAWLKRTGTLDRLMEGGHLDRYSRLVSLTLGEMGTETFKGQLLEKGVDLALRTILDREQ